MKVINPVYRVPSASDTQAEACVCRCEGSSAAAYDMGWVRNGCACHCKGSATVNSTLEKCGVA